MTYPETPESILNDPSLQLLLVRARQFTANPDVNFRSRLVKIAKPMDELVALLNALFFHAGLDAASNHFLTPSDRIQAVAADLDVLVHELDDIGTSEDIEAEAAATVARERKLLAALRRRLERAASPGLRRKRALKSK